MMMQTETVGKFFYPRFQISLNCLNLRAKNQIVEFFIEFMDKMDSLLSKEKYLGRVF